jgi:hypothetical protein
MGRGTKLPTFHADTFGIPKPVVPTENKGIMSGPIRKPRRQGRRMRPRGSRPDVQLGRVTQPDGSTLITYGSSPRRRGRRPSFENLPPEQQKEITARRNEQMERRRRRAVGRRMPPRDRPLTGGYDPKSGVRYTDTGVPTAVEQTKRVPVQDPTLGGPPEREVPIPKERRQRITRESDPRGGAPFSPDERAMARDRFFETMFDRADERKQQKAMERAERDNVGDALRSERELRASEVAGPGDERQGRRQGGGGMRRRRRGGGMRRRRGRRRDFTRRRSQMEGGRRGRSGREMAEFRDRYVSTLR